MVADSKVWQVLDAFMLMSIISLASVHCSCQPRLYGNKGMANARNIHVDVDQMVCNDRMVSVP